MSRLSSFLTGLVVGALLCYGATNYHVVRAQDGIHFVHKTRARLSETYVDVRAFGLSDWSAHPELAAALAQGNKQHIMQDAAANSVQDGVEQFLPNWPTQ
jgi:hypothetical protein